jgi:homoserine kinase type II
MDSDLTAVLANYPAVARPLADPEPLGNAGGLSGSRLWRYPSGRGTLLARAWPPDGPPRSTVEAVHGWLVEAADLGFVPVPLRGLDGRTLYERAGRLWEVAPWMPGTAESGSPPSPAHVRAAFRALGAFHQRLCRHGSRGPSPGLRARLAELRGWLGGGFDQAVALLSTRPDDPDARLARRWVDAARARGRRLLDELARAAAVEVPLQPCLRDARPEHVLFTGEAVTGLVDFGAMGVETVAADVARLLGEWALKETGGRDVALSSYATVRPLGPEETGLVAVFERSTSLLGGGHWVRWHFVEGRRFEDSQAVHRGLTRGLERLLVPD